MYAKTAAVYLTLWCKAAWPDDPKNENMGSTMASGNLMDVFDHRGHCTHKYIPAKKLSEDLGEKEGSGVYGSFVMSDGSYLLLTCRGKLAYWSGKEEDKAEWVNTIFQK